MTEERPPDPIRRELVERWISYLDAEEAGQDIFDWLDAAFAAYRDEIVHIGLQRFNDHLEVAPAGSALEMARSVYAAWLSECERFDPDPEAWEREFWREYVDRLRATRPDFAGHVERRLMRTINPGDIRGN